MSSSKKGGAGFGESSATTHGRYVETGDLLGLGGSSSSAINPPGPQSDIVFTPTTTEAGGDDDLPPSYEEEGTSLLPHPSHSVPDGATNGVPMEPPPDFTPYVAEHHENTSTGQITSYDRHLNEDGEALYRFLLTQNMSSPRPQIKMRGTHIEERHTHHHNHHNGGGSNDRRETEHRTIVDFDIVMDFQSLILIEPGQQGIMQVIDEDRKAYRGGVFQTKGRTNGSLPVGTPIIPKDARSWADDYCADESPCKE